MPGPGRVALRHPQPPLDLWGADEDIAWVSTTASGIFGRLSPWCRALASLGVAVWTNRRYERTPELGPNGAADRPAAGRRARRAHHRCSGSAIGRNVGDE